MVNIYCPIYYRVYQRKDGHFYSFSGDAFYNPRGVQTDRASVLEQFGISKQAVLVELFRINGGKEGFYLANVRDRKYYYCGTGWSDVRSQLLELGIGREHPQGM